MGVNNERLEGNALIATDRPILLCPTLAKAFDVSGALLLQQIHYWVLKSPTKKLGGAWHYNTYEELADQLGNVVSVETIRKKIKQLETLGVLVTGQFNRMGYDRTKWYRIDYDALVKHLGRTTLHNWYLLPVGSGNEYRLEAVEIGGPIPKTLSKSQAKSLDGKLMLAQPPTPIPNTENPSEKKVKEDDMAKGDSSDDILKQFQLKKGKEPVPGKSNPKDLYLLWCQAVPKYNSNVKFVASFSPKQMGQLKHMARMWGEKASEVLLCVLRDWIAFTKYTEKMVGAFKTPLVPTVSFLARYAEAGMNFFLEQAPKKKPSFKGGGKNTAGAINVTPVLLEVCPKVEDPDDKITDLAFLEAFHKELNAKKKAGSS